jgi:two-component system sensor histidine kinase UhpB
VTNDGTVLLVEDNPDDVMLVRRAFGRLKLESPLEVFTDGQAAIDYLDALGGSVAGSPGTLPGLILLDLKLPGIDGLGMLRWLKGREGLRRIPVVVLTTSDEREDVDTAYDLGANSYLRKPVSFEALVEVFGRLNEYWFSLNEAPDAAIERGRVLPATAPPDRGRDAAAVAPAALRVLLVEDDPDDLELTLRELRGANWELDWLGVDTPGSVRAALADHPWDVVVCDYRLGPFEAPEALRLVREVDAEVPFIVVSGTVGEETAAELMRVGAHDFVMKSNYKRLVPAIQRELTEAATRRRNREAETAIHESEFRFRQITESISEVFWLASGELDEILFVSPAHEEMFKQPVERLYEDPSALLEVVHPDDRERLWASIREAMTEPTSIEFRIVWPSGEVRWITTRTSPVHDTNSNLVRVAGVSQDVTERHEAEEDLRSSLDALRRSERERRDLVRQLVRASEEERGRLAGDVHDDSVQAMTAVGMRLETLKRRLADPDRVEEVDRLQTTVSEAVSRLRHLLFELRPPALDQYGVAAAVRELLDRLDVPSELRAADFEEPPDELRTILYRVAQESLANIRKHAEATSVTVTLVSERGGWRATIVDDGAGFSPDGSSPGPTHVGLASMRERAEMGGGWCRVTSAPGEGTTVECWLPAPATS